MRDRLRTATASGEAWRCLRCAAFAVGPAQGGGPAELAPDVSRGRHLRDIVVLRFFALERLVRTVLLLLAAYAVWRFRGNRGSLQQIFEKELPILGQAGLDVQHSRVLSWIQGALGASETTLRWITVALVAYAAIELVEAVGLWLLKRWGEYFAFVATGVFLPLEIHELTQRVTPLRLGALLVNLALLGYLAWTKRLFGLRGGRAAYEAERRSESLVEIERAAMNGRDRSL
ncbi:DUF2127 domain-containing protein [Streptosporangium saharense]|uniref:Uncharacterized membrane protein (DUF2068 family) n=1 Tax=Streptosporangium saharense TaxID=1706840 RepID=A0A7W7QP13_9ACTN|nr:DUF2127 domain-containing protein [Streptosporangium saharense]MBB4916984.1 uncharacterized membrane protein (DUF2068 family) [Streptosporangium saharense]